MGLLGLIPYHEFDIQNTSASIHMQLRPYITRWMVLFSVALFALMTLSILAVYLQKREVPWPIIRYSLLTGFLINCCVTTERRPGENKPPGESERQRLLFGFVGVPIIMLFYWRAIGSLLNNTMTFLSFRSPPGQLVSLNEQAYNKVMTITTRTGIAIHPCEIAKDFWVLREGTLVWHGVGATSYLRIPEQSDPSLLIPLPNDGVGVIYSTGIQLNCTP